MPGTVSDDQAVLLSDIFPTAYFGTDVAGVKEDSVVVVFGCGPLGQFAIIRARLLSATRIIALDWLPDRLDMAQRNGAETVNFDTEDPVKAVQRLTSGVGADSVIDVVGIDAQHAYSGPAKPDAEQLKAVQGPGLAERPRRQAHQGWSVGARRRPFAGAGVGSGSGQKGGADRDHRGGLAHHDQLPHWQGHE
ncbi:hypothetical protein GCM10022631_16810 [Deinococcus rubellus]